MVLFYTTVLSSGIKINVYGFDLEELKNIQRISIIIIKFIIKNCSMERYCSKGTYFIQKYNLKKHKLAKFHVKLYSFI